MPCKAPFSTDAVGKHESFFERRLVETYSSFRCFRQHDQTPSF